MESIHFSLEGCVLFETVTDVPSCFSPERAEICWRQEKPRWSVHQPTRRETGGVRGGRHLWMMDERWEGLQTVRCSLYLLCLFDTEIEAKLDEGMKWGAKMERSDWMRGGGMIRENCPEGWRNHASFSFVRWGGALAQLYPASSPPPFSALVNIRLVDVLIWLVRFSGSASSFHSPREERLCYWSQLNRQRICPLYRFQS